jgi:hypothetical protein
MAGAAGVTALFAAVGVTGLSAGTIAFAAAVINIGFSMAIGTIMQALTGEDVPSMDGQGMLANKASSIAPIKVIYGYRRVGATRVFVGSSAKKHKELHMVLAIAEGEIESFDKIWINDVQYEIDGVVNDRFDVTHGGVPVVEFHEHLGATDQLADASLMERMPDQWTSNHKLSGVAYIYVRLFYDQKVWFSGIPTFTFDVKGVKVYDPRTGIAAWSDNPALCIRDYLTNDVYGRGIDETHIDDAAITVAADYCDELVTKGTSDAEMQDIATLSVPEQTAVATQEEYTVTSDVPATFSGVKKIIIAVNATVTHPAFGALRLLVDGVEFDVGDRIDQSLTKTSYSNGVTIEASETLDDRFAVGNILDPTLLATSHGVPGGAISASDSYWLANRGHRDATVTITLNEPIALTSIKVVTNPDVGLSGDRGASLDMVFQGQDLAAKRYTCNGVVDVDKKAMDILGDLLTSCRGIMVFSGGKYRLIIDKPTAVTGTASVDNITGSWNISLGDKSNTFNSVRARFFNKEETWQDDQIVVDSKTLQVNADNNLVLQADLKLPFTSDMATAKQISLANLKQSRQQIYAEFTATIVGMMVEVGDVINITHPTPGWEAKPFRILKMSLQPNDEILIGCREYDESVYDVSELKLHIEKKPDTNLPNLDTCLAPTDMVTSEEITYAPRSLDNIAPDDTLITKAVVSWTTNEPFADHAELEYLAGDNTSGHTWVSLDADIESHTDKVSTS